MSAELRGTECYVAWDVNLKRRLSRLRSDEREIYDGQIVPQIPKHVAPHTTYVAAMWAVLTRLQKSDASRFSESELGTIAASLSPIEKATSASRRNKPSRSSSASTATNARAPKPPSVP
ncbi:MAG: hypothetical protein OEN21_12015 [Myxococcales bacterium]|nr:hypothetical protein [Myxococcales bacterium]